MNWKYTYIIIFLVNCFYSFNSLSAQTVKNIMVEEGQPYVDHVTMIEGSKDMDLLVKFTFDEPLNSLTVSLISYKKLFVFQDNVRYKKSQSFHILKPQKLPYVIQSDEMDYYKYMKPLRKSVKPKRKHIFKRWIETKGLQPQPTEYKMVNDYIEQKFDILAKNNQVEVNLRDVLVMNMAPRKGKMRYELFFQTNLNRNYYITIRRNPCFGKDEQIQEAKSRKENIQKSFLSMKEKFGPEAGPVIPEKVSLFNEMQSLLLEQYPIIEGKNNCTLIQTENDQYNALVDSITRMEYSYEKEITRQTPLNLEPDYILQMARKIDQATNRWQLSTDAMEKKDLALACTAIINQISGEINKSSSMTKAQSAAVNVFQKARTYYKKTVEQD